MLGAKVGGQLRLLVLGLLAILTTSLTEGPAVRVLFLTDCSPYSDWQSIAMVYSYMYSGHNGPITRVMCCSEDDRLTYNPELLGLVETHIAPSYASDPVTGDYYVPYNKPGAVIDYLEHVTPEEEWLLVLDSDMLIRKPWRVQDFNISLGWASGYSYRYLKGVQNELADRHIPEIPRRNDTFAGPVGRRSDMVGGFFFIHRSDLKRVSKLWLEYTADVRADSEVRLAGSAAQGSWDQAGAAEQLGGVTQLVPAALGRPARRG
jgi:peptidyl serine alpha-galactosyltransferase